MEMKTYQVNENKVFNADGHDFIFLPTQNAIFEMSEEVKEYIDHGKALNEFTREDLLAGFLGTDEEKNDTFKELSDCRVFIRSGHGDRFFSLGEESIDTPIRSIVLQVTSACNLRCEYCYYSKGSSAMSHKPPMTFDVAVAAVDFLLEHSGNFTDLNLVFFGGEPLLEFDLIAAVVAYAHNQALSAGKKIHFALTTNATLLDQRMIDFLNENRVSATVSIDGFQSSHDRYRRFPGGEPSYEVILPNIRRLLRSFNEKPVAARVTLAKDTDHITPMLFHLLNLGFAEAGFAPVTTSDERYQLSPTQMNNLLDQFRDLSDQFLRCALKNEFFGFSNIIDLLVELHEGDVKQYPCGGGFGLFSVDAKGNLYLCQRLVGDVAAHMGDIYKGIDAVKIKNFRLAVARDRTPTCKDCWARKICAGGCYHEALTREGSLTLANEHYCKWIKKWTEAGLTIYAELSLKNPEYLDRLSRLRGHGAL